MASSDHNRSHNTFDLLKVYCACCPAGNRLQTIKARGYEVAPKEWLGVEQLRTVLGRVDRQEAFNAELTRLTLEHPELMKPYLDVSGAPALFVPPSWASALRTATGR